MKVFGFNLSLNRNSKIEIRKSGEEIPISQLSPEALAWLRGEDTGTPGPSLTNAYQQVVWVYRAINVLAEQIANIPFLFSAGERGRENLITSGPLQDFYAQPHPQINRFQYWELRVIWLMLRGECMRVPIFESTSSPSTLSSACSSHSALRTVADRKVHSALNARRLKSVLILDPSRFQHIVEDNRLVGWRYTGLGPNAPLESQIFLPEEVWFEKLPNPFDFWRGMAPLLVADLAAKTDFAAAAFMNGIMENNADAGLIVRTDQQLDDTQREQIKAAINNRKRRAGTADRPVLLWGVNEIVKPTLSSADLQFLENRKFSRSEICAAFGVPEEIVTITDNAKYDVMSGSRLNFIENRVAPLCARLEAEENATTIAALLSSSPRGAGVSPEALASPIKNQNSKIKNVSGWFDLDSLPILQEARRSRLAAAKTGFDMGIPLNELNRVFDLGFKPLPWGDTGYLPGQLVPVGSTTH